MTVANKVEDYTLCIIKPDAYINRSEIWAKLTSEGFKERCWKTFTFSPSAVAWFYQEHAGKSFFQGNVDFMCSGPVYAGILYKPRTAVTSLREVLGATDPAKAAPGTIRSMYGTDLPKNAAHGSDSSWSFIREAHFLFSGLDLVDAGMDPDWRSILQIS